jgi:hypothetical protein
VRREGKLNEQKVAEFRTKKIFLTNILMCFHFFSILVFNLRVLFVLETAPLFLKEDQFCWKVLVLLRFVLRRVTLKWKMNFK